MTVTSTDKKWFDELIMELRMRDVLGYAIGDTVASARELLSDTGQGAEDTFGPARSYAASLELPQESGQGINRRGLWSSIVGLLAFCLFVQVASAWAVNEKFLVAPMQLLIMLAFVTVVALCPLYLATVLRHLWLFIAVSLLGGSLGFLVSVAVPATPADAWLIFDPFPLMLTSSIVMILSSTWNTVRTLRRGSIDEISEPLPVNPRGHGRRDRIIVMVTNWLFPLFAAFMLGFVILIDQFS